MADLLTEDGLLIRDLKIIKGNANLTTIPKVSTELFHEIIQQYKQHMIQKYGG